MNTEIIELSKIIYCQLSKKYQIFFKTLNCKSYFVFSLSNKYAKNIAMASENIASISYDIILGVVLHNLIGLALALKISGFLGHPNDVKKTIGIEVAMQNSGLGMTLAILHFSKIVALPSAIFSLWHNISAAGLVYLWKKK